MKRKKAAFQSRQEKVIVIVASSVLVLIIAFLIFLGVVPNKIHYGCRDGTMKIVDMEGNEYKTVQFGRQCWMLENMNVGEMLPDEKEKPYDNTEPYKWCYENKESNCEKYGGLYTWYNAMLVEDETKSSNQGICPDGWKIPSHGDWTQFERFLCKHLGKKWCNDLIPNDEESVGWFSEKSGEFLLEEYFEPSGYRTTLGVFTMKGTLGNWWSSDRLEFEESAWRRTLNEGYPGIYRNFGTTGDGNSVKCIQDKKY
jgi:uncharacterized protein (TIGR02145 family)